MLVEAMDASAAAYQVGYVSRSQFTREYSRLFGVPPLRDVEQTRRQQPAKL
jgi:AraC-like DNA-binding protein